MHIVIKYSSNYYEITGSYSFILKMKQLILMLILLDNFKSFKYKAKLLGNTAAQSDN